MTISKTFWQKSIGLLIVIAIFFAGFYFRAWFKENIEYKVFSVNTSQTITSSITDRWELQLTNRETGKVYIYDQNVLDAIFYQYTARRAYVQEDRKSE